MQVAFLVGRVRDMGGHEGLLVSREDLEDS